MDEYVLNLAIAFLLRDELEARGYTVYMTRETHDINISNVERAQFATDMGADITIRLHADGSDDTSVNGAFSVVPSSSNAYVGWMAAECQTLGRCVIDAYCEATGFTNRGLMVMDNMTGINWSTMPVIILEMGYMSNASDDYAMQDPATQYLMAYGIANGIDAYFGV